ncbi:HNH endonuclease [Pseudomonas lundensis]|uniref:HNH endonuclease signature motif containing protein n=1 Tax=Pseudomonas lundensis TaxID=86185 RepID=UPI001BD4F621|nr:HNH endonuclease signature motif containing protein [Pseudomonas lundensis]QVQ81362.1 HNH endonuclease [Pseudomonas lundensis]
MAVKHIFPNTLGCNGIDASLPSVARCQKGPLTTSKTNYEMAKPPFAQRPERNGENARYEIHHIENVRHGGAVYDVDNLAIMTPKRHVAIHKEDRQ